MSIEQNKQTAKAFLAASMKHEADYLASLMTDDAIYWVQGKPHLFPASGEKTKAEILGHREFVPWRIGPVM